jgi:hypothetical protein
MPRLVLALLICVPACGTSASRPGADSGPDGPDAAPGTSIALNQVAHLEGQFRAVGGANHGEENALFARSSTGDSFTVTRLDGAPQAWAVAHGNGRFVAVGGDYRSGDDGLVPVSAIFLSDDGIAWRAVQAPTDRPMRSLAFGAGVFVSVVDTLDSVVAYRSSDGEEWDEVDLGPLWYGPEVVHAGGRFVAYGEGPVVLESEDAIDWSGVDTGLTVVRSIAERGEELVGVGIYDCCFGEVPEGITSVGLSRSAAGDWSTIERGNEDPVLEDIIAVGDRIFAVGPGIFVAEGEPASWSWEERAATRWLSSIAWDGADTLVATGQDTWVSRDLGQTWTASSID